MNQAKFSNKNLIGGVLRAYKSHKILSDLINVVATLQTRIDRLFNTF